MKIHTERLTLALRSTEEVLASIEAMPAEVRVEVSPDWVASVRAATSPSPWTHGFAILHRESGAVIGSCGYKGPPGTDGSVEIAYGIDPAHQRRGYASEAARALVAHAFDSARVSLVLAHTLPGPNPSTRVLTKCGFQFVSEVMDPEDGLVWRWETHANLP